MQIAARVFGVIYLIVGIVGFVPGLLQSPPADAPTLILPQFYGYLLGYFAVNWVHDLVHIIVGIWGLAAGATVAGSRSFFRVVAVIFILLFILGFVPGFKTLFGLAPLFGADAWLHLITGIIAAYFGWGVSEQQHASA